VNGCTPDKITITKGQPSTVLVSFADKNCKYFDPLEISMTNYAYANRGILVNFVRDSGQNWFFSARLNPEKMLGIAQAASRKILIMWNMVQLSQVQYDPNNNKYYYNFAYNYNWYIDQSRKELAAFIRQTLQPGDQLNLLINDGTVSSLFSELTSLTAQTLAGAERFLTDSISSTSINFGCTTPLELLQKGVASMNKKDSVVIILIDNMQHNYYPGKYDTTLVRQQAEILTPGIAPHTTLYLTMVPGSPNIINAVYGRLTPLCASQILSVTASSSLQPSLQAMATALAGKIYPFNLVFTSPSVRYPFDILGNESNNLEIRKSYLYTGRLTVSDKLTISLKGTYNGVYYSFDSTFSASDSSGYVTGISDFWAGRKVEQILAKQPTAFDNRQALNLSLQYRILSPQTALLALEKRIADSLKIKDDKPSTSDTLIIQQNNINVTGITQEPGSASFATTFTMHQTGSQVTLRLPLGAIADADPAAKELEVKIFDLRGKCIADLSNLPMNAGNRIVFSTKNMAKGFYCVRVKIGSMLFMRNFSIVN
jgi:hypothetical protein